MTFIDDKDIEACWNCRHRKGFFKMYCRNPVFSTSKVDYIMGLVRIEYPRCESVRNNDGTCTRPDVHPPIKKSQWEPKDKKQWVIWRLLKND